MARILVVEDDPDIAELIAFKLEREGHVVRAEADGRAGLAAALAEPPDLVLLDWMMPRMSGLEVCQELRADPRGERMPVIFLTAKAQEADVQRGFAMGADDFIPKPFSPRELASRVGAVLARSMVLG
ncbi:response regulator transcription factor [Miltoncostaea marina]|uniref:response regulator transcription factor n=1 Tax=Miltoncostaea marina TaxID=2843215 RepID=UPI001C3CBE2F|nr:response regulator [Miltoncostaea marina]